MLARNNSKAMLALSLMISIETLQVCEIIGPTASGTTEPFQCRLNDDRLYAVKGRGALIRGLLAEVVAGSLGLALGLPVPEFVLANVPIALIQGNALQTYHSLGVGTGFASLWHEPVEDITKPQLRNFQVPLLAKVYVFDHWIKNGDRTLSEFGGNANLLVDLRDRSLLVIDHNLAFDPTHSADRMEFHACRSAWLERRCDLLFKNELLGQMRSAMDIVPNVVDCVPAEWLESEPTFLDDVAAALSRIEGLAFWEELG